MHYVLKTHHLFGRWVGGDRRVQKNVWPRPANNLYLYPPQNSTLNPPGRRHMIEAQESAAIAQAKDNARNLKEYNQLQFIAACESAKLLVGIVYKAENMTL